MEFVFKMFVYILMLCIAAVTASEEYLGTRQGSFNRQNFHNPIELDGNSIEDTTEADLTPERNTSIIIHGHRGTYSTTLNPIVKDAFLQYENMDVIVVDWSVHASQSYRNAVSAVPSVGEYLAQFINKLVANSGLTLESLHLVGFDLGAHVAGFAGRSLNGSVARITGLSPSRDQWGKNSKRLRSIDANYVEVIHTDAIGLVANGVGDAIGNVDFYVNGGTRQPGCLLNNLCSHNRAYEVFAASLSNPRLIGNLCSNWLQVTLNTCRGFTLQMGRNDFYKFGSGIYRVNTGRRYPF